MNLVKNHITSLVNLGKREDGRKLDEYRKPIKIEYGVSAKSAEGSAKVIIGDTEVIAGVKMELGKPYPDTPDEGSLQANVELLPLSSPEFESGPPSIESIEMSRSVVDRGIRESHAIDFNKLCIEEGEKSWTILIDVYSLNDGGNLADAIGLAALAALKDTKLPKYDKKTDKIDYTKHEEELKLKKIPVSITVYKIGTRFIIDPSLNEEEASDARLMITTTEDGKVCAMQKGGIALLSIEDIDKMVEIATEKGKELRKYL